MEDIKPGDAVTLQGTGKDMVVEAVRDGVRGSNRIRIAQVVWLDKQEHLQRGDIIADALTLVPKK